jgi:hypothetical protein
MKLSCFAQYRESETLEHGRSVSVPVRRSTLRFGKEFNGLIEPSCGLRRRKKLLEIVLIRSGEFCHEPGDGIFGGAQTDSSFDTQRAREGNGG